MRKQAFLSNNRSSMADWMTIQEAIKATGQITKKTLTASDIYRHALSGGIRLSIYFQSPVILRKIRISHNKLTLRPVNSSFIDQLCLLDKNSLISSKSLIFSTEGRYIYPAKQIIDTNLSGYEHAIIQRYLAHSINIKMPSIDTDTFNYGISVILDGDIFQVFEKITTHKRICQQIKRLPEKTFSDEYEKALQNFMVMDLCKKCFPIHELPQDACFVIRHAELQKLIGNPTPSSSSSTRMSTPLSRLFWLACKHNEVISPLIRQPYKLLSIFEQWASSDGITDHLNGDTLKSALERGSPTLIRAQ
ncbi:hypothetical protein EBJ67_15940 [Salmonella enterica subsp. enterica serovar Bovismorbificans]|nr:hypothetical protein [Salmonella enterica subsp. enterica serovar Bovismorbificans]